MDLKLWFQLKENLFSSYFLVQKLITESHAGRYQVRDINRTVRHFPFLSNAETAQTHTDTKEINL